MLKKISVWMLPTCATPIPNFARTPPTRILDVFSSKTNLATCRTPPPKQTNNITSRKQLHFWLISRNNTHTMPPK